MSKQIQIKLVDGLQVEDYTVYLNDLDNITDIYLKAYNKDEEARGVSGFGNFVKVSSVNRKVLRAVSVMLQADESEE